MDVTEELSCRELVELVTEYLDGALPEYERRRFDEHLDGCEGCRNYLRQMQETIRISGALGEEAISEDARSAMLAAFRDWRTSA
jgi:anti-sigma factor RsiW